MSYVDPDYKTKKEFKEAVERQNRYFEMKQAADANGPLSVSAVNLSAEFPKEPRIHRTYNPSGMFPVPANGSDVVEGPHYPKPHRWYAAVIVRDGIVVKVK